MIDLDTLIPTALTVSVAGETLAIKPLKVGQMPAFLRAMLRQSRANLGLQTLDLYYLHNPEAQLQTLDRPTFEARLRRAFAALEQAVADGEIASYGVATWSGLRARPHERDHLSLARLCELAREIGGDAHHLRTVQLPLNLAMPEAARLQNQVLHGRSGTLLQVADELGVHVVVSAALLQGKLARHSAAGQGEQGRRCSSPARCRAW